MNNYTDRQDCRRLSSCTKDPGFWEKSLVILPIDFWRRKCYNRGLSQIRSGGLEKGRRRTDQDKSPHRSGGSCRKEVQKIGVIGRAVQRHCSKPIGLIGYYIDEQADEENHKPKTERNPKRREYPQPRPRNHATEFQHHEGDSQESAKPTEIATDFFRSFFFHFYLPLSFFVVFIISYF